MQVHRTRLVWISALALAASCSRGVDAAPSNAEGANAWRQLIPNSAPFTVAPSRDGKLDGPVTLWHENGMKSAQGEYRDEERQGLWQFWYPNGTLRWEGAFDEGVQIGLQRAWYDNGRLQSEGTWIDGELDGDFSAWHDNGRLALRCHFDHGRERGELRRWNEDGELDLGVSGVYRNGHRHDALPPASPPPSLQR